MSEMETSQVPETPKKYFALRPIEHNGKRIEAGDELPADMKLDTIKRLLLNKLISEQMPGETSVKYVQGK